MIPGATEHQVITPDGVRLAVVEAGDPTRPTLLFLHGYPDCREVWEPVMSRLCSRYHVVAYDVRGAGRSTAPAPTADSYRLERLEDDFLAVLDALAPYGPVHLVGHDWGSVQSWEFVTSPRLQGGLASFTSISGPCLDHFGLWLRERLHRPTARRLMQAAGQGARSWYALSFQLPRVPEALWRGPLGRHWPAVRRAMERLPLADDRPSDTLSEDAANGTWLYRANMRERLRHPRTDRVATVPVQLVVPLRDPYLSRHLYDDLDRWAPVLRRRTVDAGHWLPLTRSDQLAEWISTFVDAVRDGSVPSVRPGAASRGGAASDRAGAPGDGQEAGRTGGGSAPDQPIRSVPR
ncbi:alpha/beta fold hydrolase [Streptacidiphilus sp. EB129]|uniref:alpha/beta fold hydrolase n=1 Tax=Streptacidiphilus sp. EB129 TaxID=3156262 RepID=UPI00351251C3